MYEKKETDYAFIRFPRPLIDSPAFSSISIEAKTLLALILDRSELSEINADRFTDESGSVYVIYTVEEVCKKIGCGKARALRLFRELEGCGMITRKRTNGCMPSKIYITQLFLSGLKQNTPKSENQTLQNLKTEPCKVPKSAATKNNNIKNKNINNNSSIIGFARTEDEIREQIEYEFLVCDENKGLLDEIVMTISDILNGTSPTVRIGRDEIPRGLAVSRFCKLDSEHIVSVMWQIEHNSVKIRNMKSYLTAMLYNEPASYNAAVTAEFAYNRSNNG